MKLNWEKYIPLIFFGVVYFLTCYLGIVLLLWGPSSAQLLYKIYAGVDVPIYTRSNLITLLLLLHLPLVFFGAGYFAGMAIVKRLTKNFILISDQLTCKPIYLVWVVSITLAIYSLWRGQAFANITSWVTNYDHWVDARWKLFKVLSLFEFINLYVFLPISSGVAIFFLWEKKKKTFAGVVFFLGFIASALLFQKKQPIVFSIAVLLPFWLAKLRFKPKVNSSGKIWFGIIGILFGVYLLLFFVPTLGLLASEKPTLIRGDYFLGKATAPEVILGQETVPKELTPLVIKSEILSAFIKRYTKLPVVIQKTLFATNSVIFRTSVPAMYYPIVFPAKHPFYGMDWPFDRFTADDNLVVWDEMWPNTPGGSISTPFQFPLYAQVGMMGTLILSTISGILLGIMWAWFIEVRAHTPLALMEGAAAIIFAIYLAIDSIRNSIISSYGIFWGGIFILLVIGGSRIKRYVSRV